MPGSHVLTMVNVWTMFGEAWWYGNGETDIIQKLDIVNAITGKSIAICLAGEKKFRNQCVKFAVDR